MDVASYISLTELRQETCYFLAAFSHRQKCIRHKSGKKYKAIGFMSMVSTAHRGGKKMIHTTPCNQKTNYKVLINEGSCYG